MIAIIFPSNTKNAHRFILSERSMMEMRRLSTVGIGIAAQGECDAPYMKRLRAILTERIELRVSYHQQEPVARMAHLRTRSALLWPEATYYFIVDDNVEFVPGSARKIKDAVQYLEKNPQCGMVACAGHFGGHPFGGRITPFRGRHIATDRGLLLRNCGEAIFPPWAWNYVGGGEEDALSMKKVSMSRSSSMLRRNTTCGFTR